jgi:hypothetical protein
MNWHRFSFATPQLCRDPSRLPTKTSARRSLDYDEAKPAAADRRQMSALYVDAQTRQSCPSPRASTGATTVKQLLTPIAERMQRQTEPRAGGAAQPEERASGELDSTLTAAERSTSESDDIVLTSGAIRPPDLSSTRINEDSDQSRWSTTDYFRKYPCAGFRDPPSADNRSAAAAPHSSRQAALHKWVAAADPVAVPDNDSNVDCVRLSPCLDVEFSTLLSSVHADDPTAARESRVRPPPEAAPSDTDSVATGASLDSVSTEDDAAFRAGLAQLDANIARVQQQLRGSTSTPAVNVSLGRSYNSA